MARKIETTYKAVFAQMVAGAYNGKEFIAAYGVSAAVASNQAYMLLGAVGFGGYVGDIEVRILCVKRDRYAQFDDPSATWSTVKSRWYARFDSKGVFETRDTLEGFNPPQESTVAVDDSYITQLAQE